MPKYSNDVVSEQKKVIVMIMKLNPAASDSMMGRMLKVDHRTITKYREQIEEEIRAFITERERERQLGIEENENGMMKIMKMLGLK